MLLPMALRETAQVMLWELEANRLRVGLAPCQRGRRHSRIRVVEETNPDWYRTFVGSMRARERGRDAGLSQIQPSNGRTRSRHSMR